MHCLFILLDSECLFTWELVRILGLLEMITFLWRELKYSLIDADC